MSVHLIIPARLASQRLPAKMLADVHGVPLVIRTFMRAQQTTADNIVLAVDSDELVQVAVKYGARAIKTDPQLRSGTERCCAAAQILGLADDDIVVNMQGDEPLLPIAAIDAAIALAKRHKEGIATAAVPIGTDEEQHSANVVKVVVSEVTGEGIYFSRSPIPYNREKGGPSALWRHLGIYAMYFSLMRKVVAFPQSSLEKAEMLEQLRAIENGIRLYVATVQADPGVAVDTQADLEQLRATLKE